MRREEELEELYKNLKKQETPDLWSRIEEGIETERAAEHKMKEDNLISFSERHQKKVTGKQIRIMATIAAAIVMLMISIPLVSNRMDFYKNSVEKAVVTSAKPIENNVEEENDAIVGEQEPLTENMESNADNSVKTNADTTIEYNTDVSPDKEEMPEHKKEETKNEANVGDKADQSSSTSIGTRESISLEKVSKVDSASLQKIKSSDLSKNVQKQLKNLLEDYDSCKFYKSEAGKVYVKEKGVLYLVKGVTI